MKVILVDGNDVKTKEQLHSVFRDELDLPSYYGNNLDALFDCMTEIQGEIGIISVNGDVLEKSLGKYWKHFLELMKDLEREKEDFYFLEEPFKKYKV